MAVECPKCDFLYLIHRTREIMSSSSLGDLRGLKISIQRLYNDPGGVRRECSEIEQATDEA